MSTHSGPSEPTDHAVTAQRHVDGLDTASGARERPPLVPGARLGRYLLLHEVGAGGMGVVMAAYDQELDRRVALKLLRPHLSESGEDRMRREARSLAQLQHPSVVTVYEVGSHEGQLYIAMEFVDGVTLERWAARHRSQWRKIVEVASKAGRGLAAAHSAGLVHRDIKPSNVLVGRDGRVCVADFGIATAIGAGDSDRAMVPRYGHEPAPSGSQDTVEVSGALAAASQSVRDDGLRYTEAGTVVGTPAFMAPEQHRGQAADARSDQFAFCVTLYRVLYDDAPFAGDKLDDLRESVAAGAIKPPPAGSSVPASVRRVLLRGLLPEPARRWPSMTALLDALERTRHRRRRFGVLVAVVTTAAVIAIVGLQAEPSAEASCPTAQERLSGVWDEPRTAALHDAFVASDLPYALDTWTRTHERLDRYADAWSRHYEQLCRSMHPDTAGPTADLEMTCLGRRREELGALIELLAAGDAAVVARAAQAAAELEPVEGCRIRGAEAAELALPPPEKQAAVDEIGLMLARAEAAYKMGMVSVGIERAIEALERARGLDYLPVEVDARYRLGKLQGLGGELDEAEKNLGEAAVRAVEARHDRVATQAAIQASFVVGYQQGRPEEGLVWLRHATAAMDRLEPDPLLEAEAQLTRAAILSAQGQYEPALADFRRGLHAREEVLGKDHPIVAASYNNVGSALVELGRFDEALEALEHAKRIWETSYGPRHPAVGAALNGIGVVLEQMGRWAEARQRLEQALSIREEAFGADHINVALTLDNLGSILTHMGEYDRAREVIERGLEMRERTLGPTHPHYPSSLVNLALVAEKQGQLDEACELNRRALELWEDSLGPEHPYLGFPLTSLGRAELALGHPEVAREVLERALQLRSAGAKPTDRAETRLALADAQWPEDPVRARDLAERARAEVRGPAQGHVELRDRIEAWLTAHPAPP